MNESRKLTPAEQQYIWIGLAIQAAECGMCCWHLSSDEAVNIQKIEQAG